ncbi:kelch-like protein 24 [Branchiostoma floridae]|nr:kelch-like protein 24 [Branchiostoma floridae]
MLMDHHLESTALSYVMKEFSAASQTPDFLDLTKELLITIISSDDLNAPEEIVYASVMKWIRHAPRKREKEMRELVELVRFPWMDKLYFIQKVQSDKILCKCCPDIVSEALKYQAYPGEVQSPRTRPRRASGLREAVVVIGGTERFAQGNPPIYSNDIMMTHSSTPSNTTWGSMTTMKRSNDFGFAVAVLGTSDIMVSVGIGELRCKDVWLYQARLDCWSNLAPINTARIYHKLAVVQVKVYAVGGKGSFSLRGTAAGEVYDRTLNKWTVGVPLPEPRYQHAAAGFNGSMYMIGGFDADYNSTSTVYQIGPGDSQWYSVSHMPEKAIAIAASALNGSIYVAGLPSKVLCYRPQEDLWTVVANTGAVPRCGMTVFGGEIYIYRGSNNGSGTNKVLWLDRQDESLKQVGTMPKGLFRHGCVNILKS